MAKDMASDMVKDMPKDRANKKYHPPAYYRYRENHPTISIVLTKDLKNFLDSQMGDTVVSYSQLVKKFIDQGYDLIKTRNEAYAEGYTKATNEAEQKHQKQLAKYRAISLGSCSCGKPLVFNLEDPGQLKVLRQGVTDSQLVHTGCQPKPIILRVPKRGGT